MRVLVVCHKELVPPKKIAEKKAEYEEWRTEYFVGSALRRLGYKVDFCGINDKLAPLREKLKEFRPDVVFNLLEEFAGERLLEFFIVSYFEQNKIPFTGCSSESLIKCKNKIASKIILKAANVPVPLDQKFPKIIKYASEESSFGISDRSIVYNKGQEKRRRKFLREQLRASVFAEEYIEGREIQAAYLFTKNSFKGFSLWETKFGNKLGPRMMTEKMKWDFHHRDALGVCMAPVTDLNAEQIRTLRKYSTRAIEALGVDGPVRLDFRWHQERGPYLLEVNPNPDLARWDEYAMAALDSGVKYDQLIQKIVQSAHRY